jgi:hypothetical protein
LDVALGLVDLAAMHPLLLWDSLVTAAAAVLGEAAAGPPYRFTLAVQDVPGFGSAELCLHLDPKGIRPDHVSRLRRTYEPSRLVELAAIVIAGAGLSFAGRHEIRDLAVRGSAADYLVDDARRHLEIAGRSRRVDMAAAWQQKCERLKAHQVSSVYVCVAEFESPAGRLAFLSG